MRFLTRFVCSALVITAAAAPATAQDEAVVDVLADVLAAEDARRFDLPTLRVASAHPNPLVRRYAALAVGRIGDHRGTPLALRLTSDLDSVVRLDAVFALGLLADSSAAVVEMLRPLVLGRLGVNPELRQVAITAAVKINSSSTREIFAQLFDGPLPTTGTGVRTLAHAAQDMWRAGDQAPLSTLERFANSGIAEIRKGAVYALFRLRARSAAGIFLGGLGDEDPEIRGWSARTLTGDFIAETQLDRHSVAEQLGAMLRDSDAGVRVNALRSLATYEGSAGLASEVIAHLNDRDPGVIATALTTLRALNPPNAADLFQDFVDRGRLAYRLPALLGLVNADRTLGIRTAAAWIQSEDWVLRMGGADALGALGGDTANAWLADMTGDPDVRVAGAALRAIAANDSARGLTLARKLIGHFDVGIRTRAAAIIGRDPKPQDVALLVSAYAAAQRDREADARLAIIRALGRAARAGTAAGVAAAFFDRYPTSPDYLARRAAQTAFGDSLTRWGSVHPIETGRTKDDYRQIVRRFVLPSHRGDLPRWEIETERGRITIELFGADAPITVATFFRLAEQGYFDNGRWHRVVHNFVIQDGDPRGDGSGGPGLSIRDEINRHVYDRGAVGMALSGPDTGGTQFFITHAPQPHLDGTYTVFGRVRSGMAVVNETTLGDRIRTTRVRR